MKKRNLIIYRTKSGVLKIQFADDGVQLEFPSILEEETIAPDLLITALGVELKYVWKNKLYNLKE